MRSDIVEGLRKFDWYIHTSEGSKRTDIPLQAATEIERLREALTEARKFINERGLKDSDYGMATDTCNILAKIDAALSQSKQGMETRDAE